MESNQSKTHHKKCAGKQYNKRQQLESPAESMPKVTRIIDLNDDCLVKIFGHLDLQSLFNVAVANEWLRPAAGDVYKRKYGAKSVQISRCDDYRPSMRAPVQNIREIELHPIKEIHNCVKVRGLKTTLQCLRCFGSSISDLRICYKQSQSKRYGYLHQYINDYCFESLTDLSFLEMPNIAIEQFQKNFVNVREVHISRSDLKEQLSLFSKWFPNMLRLNLFRIRMGNQFIASQFQSLEELSISGCTEMELKTKVAELLRMNRQLKILSIDMNNERPLPAIDLLDAIMENASLTKLTVSSDHYSREYPEVNSEEVQRVAIEHSGLVGLSLQNYRFQAEDAIALIRQLGSLKKFRFWVSDSEYLQLVSHLKNSEWRTDKFLHKANNQMGQIVTLNR